MKSDGKTDMNLTDQKIDFYSVLRRFIYCY